MYTTGQLLVLADAYRRQSGISESRMGILAAGNDRLFIRLRDGYGCYAETAQRASNWFNAHWPNELPWPAEVPDQRERPPSPPTGGLEPIAFGRDSPLTVS